MKRSLSCCIAAFTLAAFSFATPITLDFENALSVSPGGDDRPVSTQYTASHGVTFGLLVGVDAQHAQPSLPTFERRGQTAGDVWRGFLYGPTNQYDTEAPAAAGQLGNYFLKTARDVANVGYVKFTMLFTEPLAAVSGEIWDIDGLPQYGTEQWLVTAYDIQGQAAAAVLSPVGDDADPDSLDGLPWAFNLAADGIAMVEIEFVGTKTERVGLALDNIQMTVPEPASFALLGLGGLSLLRRRR